MAYFNKLQPAKLQTQDNIDYLCVKAVAILSEDDFDFAKHYQEMYQAVFQTLTSGLGRELYVKLQALIGEFLQKLHGNLTSSPVDGHKMVGDNWFLLLFRQWFDFSERLVILRQLLLNLESVLENSVGEESLVLFSWRFYRSILMDGSAVVSQLLMDNIATQSWGSAEHYVMADNGSNNDQMKRKLNQCSSVSSRRSLFSDDVLYDFLRSVDTASLGLSVALCCRRFANFSDFVLRARTHSDCALMLFGTQNQLLCPQRKSSSSSGPFAFRLWDATNAKVKGRGLGRRIYHQQKKMTLYQVVGQWFCNPTEQTPLELSDVEVPGWITGMRFLYLLDGITPSMLSFLRLISPMLKNCCLKFELTSFWSNLQSSGHLLSFLSLFNPLAFSIHLTFDELQFYCVNRPNPYFYKLPLWAMFQNVFFPNCYDLSLPLGLLSSREIGIDIAIWLHNKKSGTELPRRILLVDHPKEMDSMEKPHGLGINAMVGLIRERFGEDTEKCHFIVESATKLVTAWEERFLLNGNGECLLISPNRIVRCSNGDEHAKFEQFHKHLSKGEAEKSAATVQIGTKDSIRWLKEVMTQIPRK